MTVKTIKIGELTDELKEFTSRSIQEQKGAVLKGMAKSIPILVEASPVDTGLYAQSWSFSADETSALLGNFAPHAVIIELGTRPFTPPIAPLLQWAKRVLKDPSQPPNYSEQVWALARGTQNKIAREGIKPRHILENALPQIIENIREEFLKL